jgi:4-hydroxybenzoate polyprenyltransferase
MRAQPNADPGRIRQRPRVFAAGLTLLTIGIVLVARDAGARSGAVAAALALAAAIVYDAWHKEPAESLLMGLCRALVYLTAGLAAAGQITGPLLAGALASSPT